MSVNIGVPFSFLAFTVRTSGLLISLGSFLSVEVEVLVHIQQFARICQLPLEIISSRKSRKSHCWELIKLVGMLWKVSSSMENAVDNSWLNASQHLDSVTCVFCFYFILVLDCFGFRM